MKKIKINLPENYKKVYTVEDVEIMKELAKNFNDQPEEDAGIADAAKALANLFENDAEVLAIEAETAKNCRVYNYFAEIEESRNIDIWITVKALGFRDFYILGAYLSDIWSIGSDNHEEIKQHVYKRQFTEKK